MRRTVPPKRQRAQSEGKQRGSQPLAVRPILAAAELRFAQPIRAFRPFHDVHRAILGKEPSEDTWTLDGEARIRLADRMIDVMFRRNLVAVVQTGAENSGAYVPALAGYLWRTRPEFPGTISRFGVRSHWLTPVTEDWDVLAARFQSAFLGPVRLDLTITDLSVVYEVEQDETAGRIQLGPMEKEQLLQQLLRFPEVAEGLERFLFVDIDIWTASIPTYERDRGETFIARLSRKPRPGPIY